MALTVYTTLKELAGDMNLSGNFQTALDKEVKRHVTRAIERAKANGRKTVMGKDV